MSTIIKTFAPGILAGALLLGGVHLLHKTFIAPTSSAQVSEDHSRPLAFVVNAQSQKVKEYAQIMRFMQTGRID